MSTWTTPATWINGAVSAATMNTEVRDHLNWLKGFADLITNSTASDVGTTTRLAIIRTNATDDILQGKVTGDTNQRYSINADGAMDWGPGTAGFDVRLRRSVGGGGILVDDGAGGGAAIESVGSITQGKGTADEIILQNGYIEMDERDAGDPAAPSGNRYRLFARDNGSGKTQIAVRFSTGAVIVLATQP